MSLTAEDRAAREALRARQGAGARYDAREAPAEDLLLARRGTAYFARKLGELSDDDLDASSLRRGWSRRHLIAHVGYHARMFAQLVEAARTGQEVTPESDTAMQARVELGTTLPPRALRSLVHHAAIHLDIEWRDLTNVDWEKPVRLPDGQAVVARETPRLRAIEVWHGAVDLGNGGRASDIPPPLRTDMGASCQPPDMRGPMASGRPPEQTER